MIHSTSNKGFGLVGLTAFILAIGTLCTILSVSSLRSTQGSVRGINKLQTLAAAEGAAVLLAAGEAETSSSVRIGNCVVNIQAADENSTGSAILSTDPHVKGKVMFTRKYQSTLQGNRPVLEVLP